MVLLTNRTDTIIDTKDADGEIGIKRLASESISLFSDTVRVPHRDGNFSQTI